MLAGVLLLGGCHAAELRALRAEVAVLRAETRKAQEAQEARTRRIEDNLTEGLKTVLCPKEVLGLVRDVALECKSNGTCTNQYIAALVQRHDPSHKGRFLSLLDTQPHVALYSPARPDGGALSDEEDTRLKTLVQPPWLPSTRFLVVSHPDPAERGGMVVAQKRGEAVIDRMKALGFQPEFPGLKIQEKEQVLHWVFPFWKRGDRLRAEDGGGPILRSVWVFRVNC